MAAQTQAQPGAEQQYQQQAEPDITGLLSSVIEESAKMRRDRVIVDMAVYAQRKRMAQLFVASGFFESAKDREKISHEQAIAQAMVRIELGASMGFTEAESMQGIDIIQGRPAISAQLRASKMQEVGFDWDIDWHTSAKGECVGITIWLSRNGKPLMDKQGNQVSVSYMEADAVAMLTTVWENGQKKRVSILEKDNWKMSPRNMYFARCITNAQRWYAPGALKGVQILTREEAQDLDTIAEETERQRAEGPIVLQPPKLKAAPKPEPAETEDPPTETAQPSEAFDPDATVSDERADEIRAARDASKIDRKKWEALMKSVNAANPYQLTNRAADLVMAELARFSAAP